MILFHVYYFLTWKLFVQKDWLMATRHTKWEQTLFIFSLTEIKFMQRFGLGSAHRLGIERRPASRKHAERRRRSSPRQTFRRVLKDKGRARKSARHESRVARRSRENCRHWKVDERKVDGNWRVHRRSWKSGFESISIYLLKEWRFVVVLERSTRRNRF